MRHLATSENMRDPKQENGFGAKKYKSKNLSFLKFFFP